MGPQVGDERKAPTRAWWRMRFDVPGLDHAHAIGRIDAIARGGGRVAGETFDGARVARGRSDLDERRRVRGGRGQGSEIPVRGVERRFIRKAGSIMI